MWIVVWIQERLTTATAVLVVGTLILTLGLVSVCNGLVESGPYLEKNGLGGDIWCTRLLVQNGELLMYSKFNKFCENCGILF